LEVAAFYEEAVLTWFEQKANATQRLPVVLEALLTRQFDYFCEAFELFAEESFSYFDVTGKAAESFYHAFVLGMLVQLQPTHSINSNRESGFGRYDVCLIPIDKSQPAFILSPLPLKASERWSRWARMPIALWKVLMILF
jgi:hypothetical protein